MLVLSERGNKAAIWLAMTSVALYVGIAWVVTGPADTREWLLGYVLAWSLYLGLFLVAGDDDFVASPWVLLAWAVGARLALAGSPVWLSDDLYRYLLDGRVLEAGINPFRYPPEASEIVALFPDLAARVNHPEIPTIYPPLIQVVGWLAATLDLGVMGWKLLISAVDVGVMLAVCLLFGRGARGWRAAAVYGLCPLAIWESAGNGHIEALAALPLLLAAHWMRRHPRPIRAGVALALAALAKYYALLLLPLWIRERGFRRFAATSVALVGLCLWPFTWKGVDILEGLRTYLVHWSFNSPLFSGLEAISGGNDLLRILPFVLVVSGGVVVGWKREEPLRMIPMLLFAFLVIGPTLHPWYALWLLPWLGDRPHLGHWSFVAAMGGSYAVWWSVYTTGIWQLPTGVPELLWSVVALGWIAEFWRDTGSTPEPI